MTSEAGWHYDGSDPKIRRYSTLLDLRRACWRVDAGCALAADERAYGP